MDDERPCCALPPPAAGSWPSTAPATARWRASTADAELVDAADGRRAGGDRRLQRPAADRGRRHRSRRSDRVCAKAAAPGIDRDPAAVSHAFHSPLVAPAADALRRPPGTASHFAPVGAGWSPPSPARPCPPTPTCGRCCAARSRDPVRFAEAVGAGRRGRRPAASRSARAASCAGWPARSRRTSRRSRSTPTTSRWPALLRAVAAAYVLGAAGPTPRRCSPDRLTRPLARRQASSRSSPAPASRRRLVDLPVAAPRGPARPRRPPTGPVDGESTLDVLRRLAAERAELPLETVTREQPTRSTTCTSARSRSARSSTRPPAAGTCRRPRPPTNFATATVGRAGRGARRAGRDRPSGDRRPAAGRRPARRPWVRAFTVDRTPAAAAGRRSAAAHRRAGRSSPPTGTRWPRALRHGAGAAPGSATACCSACRRTAPRTHLELALAGGEGGAGRAGRRPGSCWCSERPGRDRPGQDAAPGGAAASHGVTWCVDTAGR